jgi:hypothetical protein
MQQNHELHTTHEMIRDRVSELNIAVQALIDAIDGVAEQVEQATTATMRDLHTLEDQFGHIEQPELAPAQVEPAFMAEPTNVVDLDAKRREVAARDAANSIATSTTETSLVDLFKQAQGQ